jgi:hypothetical protein
MRLYRYILLTLGCALTSCVYDGEPESPAVDDEDEIAFTFTLTVNNDGATARGTTWGDEYVSQETTYDNSININDVHVAIFDAEGTFMQNVDDLNCYKIGEGVYQYYGKIKRKTSDDKDFFEYGSKYRCMVVANSAPTSGVIDFEKINEETFLVSNLPQGTSSDIYIPMWGVQTFEIEKGVDTQDAGTIWMLRAAAKCRLHFSEDLLKETGNENLQLIDVKFRCSNANGYVVPNGYDTADNTRSIDYVQCFNPTTQGTSKKSTTISFINETALINGTDALTISEDNGTQSAIAYLPECTNASSAEVDMEVTVFDGQNKSVHTVPLKLQDIDQSLTRNHVYDLTITGIKYGLTFTLMNTWQWSTSKTVYYDDDITWKGDLVWSGWDTIDTENKIVTLKKGTTLIGEIDIVSPINSQWFTSLTTQDPTEPKSSIIFIDGVSATYDSSGLVVGTTYTSGTIDGENKVTFYIRASDEASKTEHRSTLTMMVIYGEDKSTVIKELSGWTIVQTIS